MMITNGQLQKNKKKKYQLIVTCDQINIFFFERKDKQEREQIAKRELTSSIPQKVQRILMVRCVCI